MKEKVMLPAYDLLGVTYIDGNINPKDLDVRGNPIIDIATLSVQDYYMSEARRFNHYEIPVITHNNVVLTHADDVITAVTNELKTIPVKIIQSLDENQYIRLAVKAMPFMKLEPDSRIQIIELLEEHLRLVDKEWYRSLQALGHTDINEKLAAILKCSKETIKKEKRKEKALRNKTAGSPIPDPTGGKGQDQELVPDLPINTDLSRIRYDEIIINDRLNSILIDGVAATDCELYQENDRLFITIPLDNFKTIKDDTSEG